MRFFRHPKKRKKVRVAIKRLRTFVGILIRDIGHNLAEDKLLGDQEAFDLFDKVRMQQIKDSNKVYSLHESHIYAIAKGKDYKPYEYGTKASIMTTMKSGIIVGVSTHDKNEYDSKTLESALCSANSNRTKAIKEAICDRGKKEVDSTKICLPGVSLKRDTKYQKEQKRKKFRRRAAIEPIIGHLKSDHRLSRNYFKEFIENEINLLLTASAFNLKKWMNNFIQLLFMLRITLFIYALWKMKADRREKYADLFLLVWRLC